MLQAGGDLQVSTCERVKHANQSPNDVFPPSVSYDLLLIEIETRTRLIGVLPLSHAILIVNNGTIGKGYLLMWTVSFVLV
jgi:hypothetical protein